MRPVLNTYGDYIFHQNGKEIKKAISLEEKPLQNDWILHFDKGWDTPETIEMAELKSLTEVDNEAVKHYSGTTTYTKIINLETTYRHTVLDLGVVANMAELWCNAKKVDVNWAPPFVFDISEVIQKGKNKLEIKVTNTWRNQLIFDNTRSKDEKKTWTINPPKNNETDLEPSGLIGQVVLKMVK